MITVLSTLGEGLETEELCKAEQLLERCRKAFEPDRGLILLETQTAWSAAALYNLPAQDFWNPQHLSLAGLDAAARMKAPQVMMDAPVADEQRLLALMSGHLFSFMTCPTPDGAAIIYLSRDLSSGVYQEDELRRLEELLKTYE